MSLVDDIRQLHEQTLAELAAAHDYYVDTRIAWRVVQRVVKRGNKFTVRNAMTQHETTEVELVAKSRDYVAKQLAQATFQQFVSIFENYFFDLLRLWLAANPGSLKEKSVKYEVVLDSVDKDAITAHVIERQLNEVMYKRVREWFEYLDWLLKLGVPQDEEISRIAEAKATRDIFVHNRGVANKTYVEKAGTLARAKAGQPLDISGPYHQQTWELFLKVIADIAQAVTAKVA